MATPDTQTPDITISETPRGTIPVSVIVMTKNEERAIRDTLHSVRDFAQVFVVDSSSTDATCDIARELGATVVPFTWDGAYPKKKEWSLQQLPFDHDWVLYLDADERVSPELAQDIREAVSAGHARHAAFDVELDYYFLGRKLRHGHRVSKRVLLRRRTATWPRPNDLKVASMWEVEGHYQPAIDGSIGRLRHRLHHQDPDPLYDYFARHNRYSDWEAHLLAQKSAADVQAVRSDRGRRYARVPFKPLAFFLYSFVARRGFLDGRAGFHYAVAHAFYFWQISLKRRELLLSGAAVR